MKNGAAAVRFLPPLASRRAYWLAPSLVLTLLAGCGGGGSSGSVPPPPPALRAPALLSVTMPVASQAAAGQSLLAFRAAFVANATFPVQMKLTITGGTGAATCAAGVDYVIPAAANLSATVGTTSTAELGIASASAVRQINLAVCPGSSASDKTLSVAWTDYSNGGGTTTAIIRGSANASLALGKRLNDTGITTCSSGNANGLACPQTAYPGQDGDTGRDANASITGSGTNRGTAFVMTALPSAACVQDSVTGLTWEGKTSVAGLHAAGNTYTWLSSAALNGGAAGTAGAGVCTGSGCDTEKFVAAVNAEAHCGFTDWRLPTADELANIVDAGASAAPTVSSVFANQEAAAYWSASPRADDKAGAWAVDFSSGVVGTVAKSSANRIRLVRGH